MPRRRSRRANKPLSNISQSVETRIVNKELNNANAPAKNNDDDRRKVEEELQQIDTILGNENHPPCTSSTLNDLSNNAAALYDELDVFRSRWRRELAGSKSESKQPSSTQANDEIICTKESNQDETSLNELQLTNTSPEDEAFVKAKKLFLTAVNLEQDEMHFESIKYYKEAMHLCPDIEKKIFKEQCELSKIQKTDDDSSSTKDQDGSKSELHKSGFEHTTIYDHINQLFVDAGKDQYVQYCKPAHKLKQGMFHLSEFPMELVLQIFRYVVGEELDLASLESLGLVCRGFYLLTRDQSLWRSICYSAWGEEAKNLISEEETSVMKSSIDWRQIYIHKPRVNYDGVYLSRTRYIRQGDAGFQDITYRPFHVVRYYRYLRFFPDRRVLILTTNEEPDKIIPIFRHALHSKHFSPELSILEGRYEFHGANQIDIVAEKDCRAAIAKNLTQRRRAQFHWSSQTPITQKFNLKFELKTADNKPFRNNVLKWLEYTISTRLETGQESTSFDLSYDSFPSLIFSRVKRFNLRLTNPLPSH